MMSNHPDRLWPYSNLAAIAVLPVILVLFALIQFVARTYLNWPDATSERVLLYVAVGLSVIPIMLAMLDYVAIRRGTIGSKWFMIDFSRTVLEQPDVKRETFGLVDNMETMGATMTSSGSGKIVSALKAATIHDVVCLDLKDGNAWWVTRLMAFCAGAVHAGSPKAIVFVGIKENVSGTFLGWATPPALLRAILDDRPAYRETYRTSDMIASQLALFGYKTGAPELGIQISPAVQGQSVRPHADVGSYAYSYDESQAVTLTNVVMAKLAVSMNPPEIGRKSLEDPPDRLTVGRVDQLFEGCLFREAIDRSFSNEQKIREFLGSRGSYVAIVNKGRYESLLRRDVGERSILRELFLMSQRTMSENVRRASDAGL
jgi:hypothetical protein